MNVIRLRQAICKDTEQMVQDYAMRIILFFEKILRIIYSLKTLWLECEYRLGI